MHHLLSLSFLCLLGLSDLQNQQVVLPGRIPLPYDVLSINTGIVPKTSEVPGAERFTTPVKPIDR